MSIIEDTRKVLQDVVAPDLKAIHVRLDAVERVMNLRFEQVDKRFEQMEKRMDERFAQNENLTSVKFDQVLARLEFLTNVVNANHQAEMRAMDLDRRMERLELSVAPRLEPGLSKS